MWRAYVLVSSVLAVTYGQTYNTTNVQQCTSNPGSLPLNTHIEGCVTPPCSLPQLQDAVIHITFRAPRQLISMRTLATAYLPLGIINLPVPYPLGADAFTCDFLTNTYCPILENEIVQYTLRMYIDPNMPAGQSMNLEFRVVDQDNAPLICIRVNIRVDPPVAGVRNATVLEYHAQ